MKPLEKFHFNEAKNDFVASALPISSQNMCGLFAIAVLREPHMMNGSSWTMIHRFCDEFFRQIEWKIFPGNHLPLNTMAAEAPMTPKNGP